MKAGVFAFAAQNYVNRYFASTSMLRRVLERRAHRFIRMHGGTMEEAHQLIDAEIRLTSSRAERAASTRLRRHPPGAPCRFAPAATRRTCTGIP